MKLLLLLSSLSLVATSATAAGIDDAHLYTSVSSFNWREYGQSGRRILKESGPLYGVGGGVLMDLHARKLLFNAKGEIFGSVVDYRGQTQTTILHPERSARPVTTDVNYVGARSDFDLGWRFPVKSLAIEPFAGVGTRLWLRDLQDSTAVTGDTQTPFPVTGYTEFWYSLYTTVGARAEYRFSDRFRVFAEGGAKYPFYVSNSVETDDGRVTCRPRGIWSAVGEVGGSYKHWRASLYYEGFEVGRSPVVSGLLQPRSASDIYGLRLGWSFR